jgi:cell division transport system permease protein
MTASTHSGKPLDTLKTRIPAGEMPRNETPIIPKESISGSALAAVIAIMTFLAALTTGAVMLVIASATEWQSDVAREVTIQVRPGPGRDIEMESFKAAAIAREFPGLIDVRPYTREESARLLEPWLGAGLVIEDLPVPRMIVVKIAPGATPDLAGLRKALAERAAGASLDDHRGWVNRMRAMASAAVALGIGVLILVLATTMLSVAFATRGAMAANRPIVEVLHFIGARDAYITAQFQRHFLLLGLKGGVLGGGAALVLFALAGLLGDRFLGAAAADQAAALFGSYAIGPAGYAAVFGQIVLIAATAAWTSRRVVKRTLDSIE